MALRGDGHAPRLYPDRFWLDVAVAIGIVAMIQAAIVFLVATVLGTSGGRA